MSSSREALQLSVDLILRNRGKTPALNILSRAKIITGHGDHRREGSSRPASNTREWFIIFCLAARVMTRSIRAFQSRIFP